MKKSELLRRMKKSKFFVIGLVIAVFVTLAAFTSPLFVVHDPIQSDLRKRLISPEFLANGINGYILGTDALGQDIFTRLVTGCRISLLIAAAGVLIPALIGTALGAIAGFFGGTIDNVIMRICDIQLSIPTMVLAITVMAIFGNSVPNLLLVLAIVGWTSYTRVVRGSVMGIRQGIKSAWRIQCQDTDHPGSSLRTDSAHHPNEPADRICHSDGSKFKLPWHGSSPSQSFSGLHDCRWQRIYCHCTLDGSCSGSHINDHCTGI